MTKKYTKNTKFSETLKDGKAVEILLKKGMHCFGCPFSQFETLEQGCKAHGLKTEEVLKELNKGK